MGEITGIFLSRRMGRINGLLLDLCIKVKPFDLCQRSRKSADHLSGPQETRPFDSSKATWIRLTAPKGDCCGSNEHECSRPSSIGARDFQKVAQIQTPHGRSNFPDMN